MVDNDHIVLLFLICAPNDQPSIDVMREARMVSDTIRMGQRRISVIIEPAIAADDVPRLLNQHRPHILHLSGHGEANGPTLLDSQGAGCTLSATQLVSFLKSQRDRLRLVYLNVCFSEAYSRSIGKIIDFVVVNRGPVFDPDAVQFAAAFYGGLSFDRKVSEAFSQGKAILESSNCVTQLFVRAGVNLDALICPEGSRYNEDIILSRVLAGTPTVIEQFMLHVSLLGWRFRHVTEYFHSVEESGLMEIALTSNVMQAVIEVSEYSNLEGRASLCNLVERAFERSNHADDTGRNFLHFAAMNNFLPLLQLYVGNARFASFRDAVDSDLRTPLHLAVVCGHQNMIVALLNSGADTSKKDLRDLTALDTAVLTGKAELILPFRGTVEFQQMSMAFAKYQSVVEPTLFLDANDL